MRTRKIIFSVGLLLLVTAIAGFGLKQYCAKCSEEQQVAGIACPPATQAGSGDKVISDLSIQLLQCNRHTDHKTIAGIITEIRNSKIRSSHTAELLSSMLPYQAEIYQGRDKWEVIRLRSYILLTLGEIGFPDSAVPALVDALAYVDERMKVAELGAAIHVVGNLGAKGSPFVENVINVYNRVFADEEFSLKRYELGFSKDEATTIQIEIARSLGKICHKKDDYAIKFLRMVIGSSGQMGFDQRVKAAASQSLDIILQRRPGNAEAPASLPFFCSWNKKKHSITQASGAYIKSNNRKALLNKHILLADHNGVQTAFASLVDRPVLLTFFYTRCENDMKCSATIAHMALLQKHLNTASLHDKIRLVAVSLEPEHDNPALLKRYLTDRGVKLGNEALAISMEPQGHQALLQELQVPVGYNSGWVNGHGIAAVLLDKDKRIVRTYSSLLSNTSEIMADFVRVLGEQ